MGKYLHVARNLLRRLEETRCESAVSPEGTRKHSPENIPAVCASTIEYERNEFYEERSVPASGRDPSKIPAKLLPPVRSRTTLARQLPRIAPEFFEQLKDQRESHVKVTQSLRSRPRKPRRPTDPANYTMPFGAWLAAKWRDPGPVGDLVSAFRQEPDESYPEQWQERLDAVQAHKGHHAALKVAVSRWKKECKKGSSSDRVGREQQATLT